ncbi:hypothetical protein HHL22_08305 [Hymenobacter sp. RP-2-7]|uniref:Uncharacterized protein n=1 Tax=Hymenobacter polaris TaxID=2682546 RepID=A0A7Y0FLV2_9BACT|nr:hypothetical protein [Hymenobacter polaris]NML65202.1 hypothetical protein [Hymenobacter polaris]
MRHFLLLLVLLLASLDACAQLNPAGTTQPQPAGPAPDTVAALHRLFAAKRAKRDALAVLSLVIAGTTGYAATQSYSLSDISIAYGTTIGALSIGGIALAYYSQYSRRREQEALEAFKSHQLAKELKRKLKRRYF